MAWPSIDPPDEISGEYGRTILSASFNSGRPITRPAQTSSRFSPINLKWNAMSSADFDLLVAAYDADAGNCFSWTHPRTSTVYTVGYVGKIKHRESGEFPGKYEVDVTLQEQ